MHVIVDDSFTTNEDLISHIMEETRSPYKDKPSSNFDDIYDDLIECTWLENVRNMRILHESLPNISDIHRYLDTLNVLDVEWEILPELKDIGTNISKDLREKNISLHTMLWMVLMCPDVLIVW